MAFYPNDAGLFATTDPITLDDAPAAPSFSSIVADGLSGSSDISASADDAIAGLGGADGAWLDDEFTSIIGDAADTAADEAEQLASSPAADLLESGARVDTRGQQVAPYLPGPDSGVQVNFADPPQQPTPGSSGAPGLGGGGDGGEQPPQV